MPVVTGIEDAEGFRCVDVVERDDHTFVECRRDPETRRWSIVGDYSGHVFTSKAAAIEAAKKLSPGSQGDRLRAFFEARIEHLSPAVACGSNASARCQTARSAIEWSS
jgi:hypothetical protein